MRTGEEKRDDGYNATTTEDDDHYPEKKVDVAKHIDLEAVSQYYGVWGSALGISRLQPSPNSKACAPGDNGNEDEAVMIGKHYEYVHDDDYKPLEAHTTGTKPTTTVNDDYYNSHDYYGTGSVALCAHN